MNEQKARSFKCKNLSQLIELSATTASRYWSNYGCKCISGAQGRSASFSSRLNTLQSHV